MENSLGWAEVVVSPVEEVQAAEMAPARAMAEVASRREAVARRAVVARQEAARLPGRRRPSHRHIR